MPSLPSGSPPANDAVTRIVSRRGAAAVSLRAGPVTAEFLPEVGMLGVSLTYEGDELLVLPNGLAGYRSGHQAGLPLLAPWANRLGGLGYETAGVRVDLSGLYSGPIRAGCRSTAR